MDNESQPTSDSEHDYVAELITLDDDFKFPTGFNALSPEEKQEWAKEKVKDQKFKKEKIDEEWLDALKDKGIEVKIVESLSSFETYNDPEKILSIREDATPEHVNEFIETLIKGQNFVVETPIALDNIEPQTEIVPEAKTESSKWSELNNLLYSLGINLEVNEKHLTKFEGKNLNGLEQKSQEIIEAIESFPNKNNLKEKFSTIRLGYPQVEGDFKIFIENNILYIDLGINEQEITDFFNSLVFKIEDKKEETIPETISATDPEPLPEAIENEKPEEITPEIKEALDKNGETIKIGDIVAWDNISGHGQGRLVSFEITPGTHIKASVDMGVDGIVGISADELSLVENKLEPAPVVPEPNIPPVAVSQEEIQANYVPEWQKTDEWLEFEKTRAERAKAEIKYSQISEIRTGIYNSQKDIIAKRIEETFRKNAGENLTPEQETELRSKINDKIFEELVKKENEAYLNVLREARGETKMGKAIEGAKSLLSTKAVQWYLGLSRKERMLVSFGVGSIAGLAFGATVAPGAIGMASYLTWRAARVGLSGTAGMKAGEWANKKWSAEELETAKTKEIADLKNSDLPLEEKTRGFEDIQKRYKKEKIKMTLKKMGTTIAAGAGTGLLTGLAEHAVMGVGGVTKSALESKGGKTANFADHKLPRKGIEFVPIKPSTPQYIEPEIEIKPTPVTEIPVPPKNLDSVTISKIPPPESVGGKIFDNPENIMHIKVEGKVNSFWETVKKGLSEDKQYCELTEAQKQNATSFFTNKGIKSPEKFGLTPDENFGVRVESGKEVDLSKLFGDPEELKRVLNGAAKKTLDEQQEIIGRSAKITTYLHEHPNVKLTNDKVADILATKPQTVPEIPEILKPKPIMTPPPEIPTESVVIPVPETLKMSEVPTPEVQDISPMHKPSIEFPKHEPIPPPPPVPELFAGGTAMAGMATMSALDRQRSEQTHEDIQEARNRLEVLEGGKNDTRNPNLERSFASDSKSYVSDIKFKQSVESAFRNEIDGIYGKSGFMGIGKVAGINSKEWAEMARLPASKIVEYYTGDSSKSGLSPEIVGKLSKSKNHQTLIKQTVGLMEQSNGVVKPFENENMEQFIKRLGGYVLRTHSKNLSQNLAKAA